MSPSPKAKKKFEEILEEYREDTRRLLEDGQLESIMSFVDWCWVNDPENAESINQK